MLFGPNILRSNKMTNYHGRKKKKQRKKKQTETLSFPHYEINHFLNMPCSALTNNTLHEKRIKKVVHMEHMYTIIYFFCSINNNTDVQDVNHASPSENFGDTFLHPLCFLEVTIKSLGLTDKHLLLCLTDEPACSNLK